MKTRNLAKGALFIALGVLLPQLFHMLGGGAIFLPMHIPVLLAGFLIGPITGLYVGLITPILSHLITGMPPLAPVPMMPIMVFELATYGLIGGVLYKKLRLNPYIALFAAMLGGRIVYGIVVYGLLVLFQIKMQAPLIAVVTAIQTGLVGIAIQIIIVPALVTLLERDFERW